MRDPGGVPERPKGTGCKPVGSAFGGSNPPAPTPTLARNNALAAGAPCRLGGDDTATQAQSRLAGVAPCQVTYPSAVTRATVVLKQPFPFFRGTRKTAFPFTPVAIRPPKYP